MMLDGHFCNKNKKKTAVPALGCTPQHGNPRRKSRKFPINQKDKCTF